MNDDNNKISNIKYITAIRVIRQELKKDQSPKSTYHGWQSNLACCIMDGSELDHKTANTIAVNFLRKLID
jgi:hypothetical protein